MTVKLGMRVFWNHSPIPIATRNNARLAMTVPFGTVMNLGGGGTGGAVDSVNGKVGSVVLNAADVGADVAGSAAAVRGELQPQIEGNVAGLSSKADAVATSQALATKATTVQLNEVKGLAESNELKLSTKAEQADLEQLSVAVSEKVDQATYNAFVQACALLASRDFVIEQINGLLGGVSIDFDTLKEIADRLQLDSDQFGVITNALSKRIRFDASQTLTSSEQQQARDNINAEAKGVAAGLVAAITPSSIGAATTDDGQKARSALQSGDVAPVALSGSFSDLVNKSSLFNLVYSAYALGSNTAILATDTLGQMLGKLQSQISANATALGTKVSSALLGAANGVATLGSDGKLLPAQAPTAVPVEKAWVDLAVTGANASGFADNTYKLQLAKEAGYIWIRGVFRNTNAVSSNTMPVTIPNAYMVKQPNSVAFVTTPATVINLNLGNVPPVFLTTYQATPTTQTMGKVNNGAFEASGIFFIAPAILGMAANP